MEEIVEKKKRKIEEIKEENKNKKIKEEDFLSQCINELKLKKTISKVAFIDLFGKLNQKSEGFELNEEECSNIVSAFENRDQFLMKGLQFEGKKFQIHKIDEDILICRTHEGGAIILKSSKHYLVAIYNNIVPTECSMAVHKTVQSMKIKGY